LELILKQWFLGKNYFRIERRFRIWGTNLKIFFDPYIYKNIENVHK